MQNRLSSSSLSKNIKVHRNTLLPFVSCGSETWSLKGGEGEEGRLRVFENRVLRKIFGPKRDEVAAGGRENYINEKLPDLYSSPNFIRVIKSRRDGQVV